MVHFEEIEKAADTAPNWMLFATAGCQIANEFDRIGEAVSENWQELMTVERMLKEVLAKLEGGKE